MARKTKTTQSPVFRALIDCGHKVVIDKKTKQNKRNNKRARREKNEQLRG